MKLLNYKDKVTLLHKAREMGYIFYNGVKISMYHDFSPDLEKRRAEFMEMKCRRQECNVT